MKHKVPVGPLARHQPLLDFRDGDGQRERERDTVPVVIMVMGQYER